MTTSKLSLISSTALFALAVAAPFAASAQTTPDANTTQEAATPTGARDAGDDHTISFLIQKPIPCQNESGT